jgi:hypothetical protein
MSIKSLFLVSLSVLFVSAVPASAQSSLGDLIVEYGYEWVAGKWVATTDDGQTIELEYKWALDKHVVLVDFKMGDFKYHGMIMFVPSREEIVQIGADNQGGTSKGTWGDDYMGAALSLETTKLDGTIEKSEMVQSRVDNDTMKMAVYDVDSYGYRNSTAKGTLTFKRKAVKK